MEKIKITPIGRGLPPAFVSTRVAINTDKWKAYDVANMQWFTTSGELREWVDMSHGMQTTYILKRHRTTENFTPELLVTRGEVYQLLPVKVIDE